MDAIACVSVVSRYLGMTRFETGECLFLAMSK
jgi:hypothetical protein